MDNLKKKMLQNPASLGIKRWTIYYKDIINPATPMREWDLKAI